MQLKDNFNFTLSDDLKLLSPIHDYQAIKREGTEFYEVWWDDEDGLEDYILYCEESVKESIQSGAWIII